MENDPSACDTKNFIALCEGTFKTVIQARLYFRVSVLTRFCFVEEISLFEFFVIYSCYFTVCIMNHQKVACDVVFL